MTDRKKVTLNTLFKKASKGTPISWLTCYDYPTAYLQEQAGIDMILVGDSLGMTMLGYDPPPPGRAPRRTDRFLDRRYALDELSSQR